jgi:hypothetical protein
LKRVARELGENMTDEEVRRIRYLSSSPSPTPKSQGNYSSLSPPRPLPSPLILQLLEMIEEADKDGDGEINEQEFMRIMQKTNLF